MLKQFQDSPHYLRRITKLIRLHLYHTRGQGDARTGIHSHASTKDHVNQDHRPAAAIPCEKDGTEAPDSTTISATCQNLNAWLRTPNPLCLLGFGFGGALSGSYILYVLLQEQTTLCKTAIFVCLHGPKKVFRWPEVLPKWWAPRWDPLLYVCAAPTVESVASWLTSPTHILLLSLSPFICVSSTFLFPCVRAQREGQKPLWIYKTEEFQCNEMKEI